MDETTTIQVHSKQIISNIMAYQIMLTVTCFIFIPRFKNLGCNFYLYLSVHTQVHSSVSAINMNIFRCNFLRNYLKRILKLGFSVYIRELYRVMRFQFHRSTTPCLPNTCIILYMIATFVSETITPSSFSYTFCGAGCHQRTGISRFTCFILLKL